MTQLPHPLCGLPLMMGLVQSPLMSWPIGLNSANSDSPLWKLLADNGNSKSNPLPANYAEALHQEAVQRSNLFHSGVLRYIHSPFVGGEQPAARKTLNAGHKTKLHYYASNVPEARRRPIVFCIPSLVNRAYILDLMPDASLIGFINAQGFDCLLLEWEIPTAKDAAKNMADYVLQLMAELQENWEAINRPLIALGYCMGGIAALALAQLFTRVQGMALLATPWDYQQYPDSSLQLPQGKMVEEWVKSQPLFSAEALQTMLYLASPYRIYQRFSRFATEQDEAKIANFVALEHWANDVTPLTQAVAHEAIIKWPNENTLINNKWNVAGTKIQPQKLKIPSFIARAENDYVVPDEVSKPLLEMLPHVTEANPQTGHVAMIAGLQRMQLWQPLVEWLQKHFA